MPRHSIAPRSVYPSHDIASLSERLTILTSDPEQSTDARARSILQLLAESLGAGCVFVAHIGETTLDIETSYDRTGMGLDPGLILPLDETYAPPMLHDAARALVIEDALSDARVASLSFTHDFGIGAYSGILLHRSDGVLYGLLAIVYPQARRVQEGENSLLRQAGHALMQSVEMKDGRESLVIYPFEASPDTDIALTPARRMNSVRVTAKYVIQVGGLASVYFGAAKLGLLLATVGAQVSLVWPPTGIALVALLLGGPRLWPGIALGATLVNLSTGAPFATACGMGAGNTLEALVATLVLRRLAFRPSLDRLRDVFALVALAAGCSTILSATIGVSSLVLGGVLPLRSVMTAWGTWWLGDALGDILVAPALLACTAQPWRTLNRRRSAELIVLLVGATLASLSVFGGWFGATSLSLSLVYLVFPFVLWATLRFGPPGAVVFTSVVSGVAIWGTIHEAGPFVHGALLPYNLLNTQIFLGIIAITGLVLAAAVSEREHAVDGVQSLNTELEHRVNERTTQLAAMNKNLHDSADRLRAVLSNAPVIVFALDKEGIFTLSDGQGLASIGVAPNASVGHSIFDVYRDHSDALECVRRALSGEACASTITFAGLIFDTRYTPVLDDMGMVSGVICVSTDVTDRVQAEKSLQTVLDHAPIILYALDAAGRFTLCQGKALDTVGVTPNSVIGNSIRENYQDDPTVLAALDQALGGEPATFVSRTTRGVFENQLVPVRGAAGAITSVIGVATDVSQREGALDALRTSEDRYRTIVETAGEGIGIRDADGRIAFANARLAAMLGYTVAELVGHSLLDFVDEAGREEALMAMDRRRQSIADEAEIRLLRKDGTDLWALAATSPMYEDSGQYVGALSLLTDITARKRAEEELRASEARLRTVLHHAPLILFALDRDGHYTLTDGRALDVIGSTPNQSVGFSLFEAFPDLADVHDAVRQALAGEEAIARATMAGRVFETHYVPERDSDGTITGVVGVATDITQRMEAEEALRSSEERYRQVQEHAPIGLALVDLDGRWLRVNPALCAIVGYTEEDLLARTFQDITYPDDLDADLAYVHQLLANEITTYRMEKRYICQNGRVVWVLLSGSLVRDADHTPLYFIAQIEDIDERKRMEEALRESEERFRLVFNEAPTGISLAAPDGRLLEVNNAQCQMLGYTEQELLDMRTPRLTLPEDMAESQEMIRRLLADEIQTATLEKRYLHKEGHVLWCHYTATLLRDPAGQPLYFIFQMQDITARKRSEEARALLATIVQTSEDAIFSKSLEGIITTWNPAAERLYGYTAAEIVGQSVACLIPDERGDELEELTLRVRRDEAVVQHETERVRKDGSRVAVSLSLSPLHVDGVVVGASVIVRDITARKQAEETLRESEERFRSLMIHAPIGTALASAEGIFELVNDAYAVFYGYAPEDMVGQPVTMVVPPEQRAVLRATYADYVARGVDVSAEYSVVTKSGELRTALGQSVQYMGPDGRPHRATFSVDITERARMEKEIERSNRELARSNTELERFTAVASHDLRSPLSTIAGFAQLLQLRYKGQLDANADQHLSFITSGVARMQALIDGLLAYTRLDRQPPPLTPVNCATIVRDVLANLHSLVEQEGATISAHDLPTIQGDAVQLSQLFQNLISNALKFRAEVAPVVIVTAERSEGAWLFRVQDNGIGLDSTSAARIFDMFGRLHTQDEYEGTGIGLAVCQKIVERHGGRIWVESQPSHGATFLFTLGTTLLEERH